MKSQSVWQAYRFPLVLLAGIAAGSLAGLYLGERAVVLKPLGDLFLNLMFTVVVPLVFISIASAVASIRSLGRLGRILGTMLAVFVGTGVLASIVMLAAVVIFPPALGVNIQLEKPEDLTPLSTAAQLVQAFTVPDFAQILSRRSLLPLIVFAILFGSAATFSGDAGRRVASLLEDLTQIMVRLVGIILWIAPLGLGAYFAALVGEFGPQLLGSYARAMAIFYPVALAYYAVFFTIYAGAAGGGRGIARFWRGILTPSVTAFATGSSVATIPSNLLAAEKIGVSKEVRELIIPIGATIHMDGSCLSAILKIAFLFGIFGMEFHGFDAFATAIGVALLSGIVMAGIPGGGFLGEMMIVTLYGFPPEALPILALIGTLVDPIATMVNATGDTVSSMVVERTLSGPGWMDAAPESDVIV